MRVQLRALLLGLAFSAGAAGSAGAACVQGDLRGTWDFYIAISTPDEELDAFITSWSACVLRINANGAIQGGTGCTGPEESPDEVTITGDRLALQRTCRARGQINFRTDEALVLTFRVTQATLTVDKGLLVGGGSEPLSGLPFIFQAVRR